MTKQYRHTSYRAQKILLWGSFVFFGALPVCAQHGITLNSLQQQFNNYQQAAAQEKIYVHVDKDFFTAGEIVWFKAYTVGAYNNQPTQISTLAYVEIQDADKKPLLQAKIKLSNGSGNGSFQLPASVPSGNYTVRAYTNWMKNFSADLYFTQKITIVNTLKSLGRQQKTDTPAYEIRFFPEGGNLVNGLESKVAFRIVDGHGKGMACSGSIIDQNGTSAANFTSLKFGIGSFNFTPNAANTYMAVVNIGNKTFNQAIPQVYKQGYVVHLEEKDTSQFKVTITSSASKANVFMLVTNGNEVKVAEEKLLQDGKAAFAVNKSTLGNGISHVIIFNDQAQPICERLYFKKPTQYLGIHTATGQAEFGTRKKVTVDISAIDEANNPQMADMSISVYRVDSLQQHSGNNILSYLLLNADLKGTIEQPDYYFANDDAASNEALDNLMLTHGWSRYNWDDIKQRSNTAFEYIPEYEGHVVTAKITNRKTGLPAENIVAYLTSPGKNFKFAVARSQSNGIAQFNVKDFFGGDAIILQTNQTQDSNYRIDIVNPFSEKFSAEQSPQLDVSEKLEGLLVQHSINTQVQNAYHSEKLRQFYASNADTLPFFGNPTNSYLLDDYTRFTTMEEVLREYVPEVAVRKHKDNFALKVFDDPHNILFDENPLVLADGVPFFNMDTVVAFNPLKIRKMAVGSRKYFLGTNIFYGVVSYTTYNGDLDGIQLDPASLVLEYEGMQLQREFYMPKYDTPKELNSRLPDFRELLYWNPEIKTDSITGKTQASFYTSDVPGNYIAVIQGLSPTGKAGSKTFTLTVK